MPTACRGADKVPFAHPGTCLPVVEEQCCDQLSACADDPECIAIRTCGGKPGCSEGPCWEQCLADHPGGVGTFNALTYCMFANTADACSLPEDRCGTAGFSATCGSCIAASCCEENYAAASQAEYWNVRDCITSCPANEPACIRSCQAFYAVGTLLLDKLQTCVLTNCNDACVTP